MVDCASAMVAGRGKVNPIISIKSIVLISVGHIQGNADPEHASRFIPSFKKQTFVALDNSRIGRQEKPEFLPGD